MIQPLHRTPGMPCTDRTSQLKGPGSKGWRNQSPGFHWSYTRPLLRKASRPTRTTRHKRASLCMVSLIASRLQRTWASSMDFEPLFRKKKTFQNVFLETSTKSFSKRVCPLWFATLGNGFASMHRFSVFVHNMSPRALQLLCDYVKIKWISYWLLRSLKKWNIGKHQPCPIALVFKKRMSKNQCMITGVDDHGTRRKV